jgi:hypothetical protein
VLAEKFTAEHAEFAEIFKTFLCELSDLGGKNNHFWATTPKKGTITNHKGDLCTREKP